MQTWLGCKRANQHKKRNKGTNKIKQVQLPFQETTKQTLPGEELVACEQVLQWLRRAKSQEFLEVSDMAVPGRIRLVSLLSPFVSLSFPLSTFLLPFLFSLAILEICISALDVRNGN